MSMETFGAELPALSETRCAPAEGLPSGGLHPDAAARLHRAIILGLTDEELSRAFSLTMADVRFRRAALDEGERQGLIRLTIEEMRERTVIAASEAQLTAIALLKSQNEGIRARVSADLMDRNPSTSTANRSFVAGKIEHSLGEESLGAITRVLAELSGASDKASLRSQNTDSAESRVDASAAAPSAV